MSCQWQQQRRKSKMCGVMRTYRHPFFDTNASLLTVGIRPNLIISPFGNLKGYLINKSDKKHNCPLIVARLTIFCLECKLTKCIRQPHLSTTTKLHAFQLKYTTKPPRPPKGTIQSFGIL